MRHTQWATDRASSNITPPARDPTTSTTTDSGTTDFSDCSSTFDAAVDQHIVANGLDIHLEPLDFGGTPAQNVTMTADTHNCTAAITDDMPINVTLHLIATTSL